MLDRLRSHCGSPHLSEVERLTLLALIHIIERISEMPTQADLDAATDALLAAFNAGLATIESALTAEGAKILAELAAIPGIPQASIDRITAAQNAITSALSNVQNEINALP